MAATTIRLTKTRNLARRLFDRTRRAKKLLRWLTTEGARLNSSATPDTFVTVAALATGIYTLSANVAGNDFATGILTLTGNALDTETVVIDGKTYTFQTALTDVDGNVLIGAAATDSIDNLIAAITLGAGAGTLYATSTTLHLTVTAAAGAGDTMDATAKTRGTAGNSLATTETLTNGSWANATLTGGVDPDTVTIGTQTYTFNAAPLVDSADNVLVGGSASATLDNLIAAINNAAGEGTTYGTGTVANVNVTAVAGAGDTMDVTAITTDDNATATTEVGSNSSWGAATLASGVASNNLTAATHGFTTGEGPYQLTTSGALPQGLALLTNYWINVVDANTFTLSINEAGGQVPTITTPGTGTHTILKGTDTEAMFETLKRNDPTTIAAATDIDDLA